MCYQRAAAYERQVDQLRHQLFEAVQGGTSDSRAHEPAPDMQHAIDILKRSSLEVELAAKEGEVRYCCLSVVNNFYPDALIFNLFSCCSNIVLG